MSDKWEGRIEVPSGGWDVSVTDGTSTETVTVTAGQYYWSSAGNGANDFAAQLAADINTAMTETFTVSISAGVGGTGKVTIAVGSGTFDITWDSGDALTLRNLCGFDANLSGETSVAGNNHAQALWLPAGPVSTLYGLTSDGLLVYDAVATHAPDGTYKATAYSSFTRNEYIYQAIAKRKVIAAGEVVSGESYESFWDDCVAGQATWAEVGKALRWYADADTDGTYKTVCITDVRSPIIERTTPEWDGWWRVSVPVIKNV